MPSHNLYSILHASFPDADSIALETDAGRHITYGELAAQTARYAQCLEKHGARPGDRIMVQVDKSPEALFLYLACLKAGLIYLPLNTAYEPLELEYFFQDAEPSLFVSDPALRCPADKGAGPGMLTLSATGEGTLPAAAARTRKDHPTALVGADDIAAIVYTSGTTGRPKGVMLSHRNLAANAATLVRIWGFTRADVLIHALPIYHVHGLFVAVHCALMSGARMHFLPKFEAGRVVDRLPHASVLMGVPTFYTRLLAHPGLTRDQCKAMRLFISGSAPLREGTFEDFEARTGHRILERYGMTETGMIASNPLDGDRIAGTVGYPLPDVAVRIATDSDTDSKEGVGQLEVRGPNVCRGYWRQPERTREDFTADGYLKTGDLARIDGDGRVSLVGRVKDLIITGGLNVYAKEVEACIDAIPGVTESAVIGLPDPDFGEVVAAVVRLNRPLTPEAIGDALDGKLAKFKRPKRFFFVEELPRNAMGKIRKNLLRQTFGDM